MTDADANSRRTKSRSETCPMNPGIGGWQGEPMPGHRSEVQVTQVQAALSGMGPVRQHWAGAGPKAAGDAERAVHLGKGSSNTLMEDGEDGLDHNPGTCQVTLRHRCPLGERSLVRSPSSLSYH